MDIKIFRAYAGGDSDFDYIFSIVATNSGASFVVPKGDVERSSVFDQQRIDELAACLNIPNSASGLLSG
jgi:hypothetical protein